MKQIVLKVLFVLFGMFIGMETFAQFYDDDKVFFYIKDEPENKEYDCMIFIFDGSILGIMHANYQSIRIKLKSDINYYEKIFSKFDYNFKYNSKLSDDSSIVYSYNYRVGTQMGAHYYHFSKDRKKYLWGTKFAGSSNEETRETGILVDKSYFLKGSKYNVENNEGTIYE